MINDVQGLIQIIKIEAKRKKTQMTIIDMGYTIILPTAIVNAVYRRGSSIRKPETAL